MMSAPCSVQLNIDEELVLAQVEMRDAQEVIQALSARLFSKGLVTADYAQAVLQRELKFPTGLPTAIPVAIPHADCEYCRALAMAVATLRTAVQFGEMGEPGSTLDVRIVFLLSVDEPKAQVAALQKLGLLFKDKARLERILAASDAISLAAAVNEMLARVNI